MIARRLLAPSQNFKRAAQSAEEDKLDFGCVVLFIAFHIACLGFVFVGISAFALKLAVLLCIVRMLFVSAFMHRYFSHKSYQTNRIWQFIFAILVQISNFGSILRFVANHRMHHQNSGTIDDPNSIENKGFWWAYAGWFLTKNYIDYDRKYVQDLIKFPELLFLEKYLFLIPLCFLLSIFLLGNFLSVNHPELNTNGMQLLIWCGFVSTLAVVHISLLFGALIHLYGEQTYDTQDTSRNSMLLALLSFGEGWHNNHHRYPSSARCGIKWWQIDMAFYFLLALEKLRIIKNLRYPPCHSA